MTDRVRVPSRTDALRVGRAILDAHGQWEKENIHRGSQDLWGEQHVILLGQAAMLAAPPSERWVSNGGDGEYPDLVMVADGVVSHPTGHAVQDAFIAGFLYAVGREPWDDMHDYAALCSIDYAKGKLEPRAHAPTSHHRRGPDDTLTSL